MAFKLSRPKIDLGHTAVENIFINDFMPLAKGDYVKVYLLGYYLACTGNSSFSNETIAKQLGMDIDEVITAWHYWQKQGIVSCINNDVYHSEHQFDVSFHSIREKYVESGNPLPVVKKTKKAAASSKLLAALSNPHVKKMFEDIEFYARRMLTPQEKSRVLTFLENYHMDIDLVVMAFYITYEERAIARNQLNYIEGIIKNWYNASIFSMTALRESERDEIKHYQLFREVSRALGINQRQIPSEVQKVVSDWRDAKNYDEDYILYVIKQATRRTNNPNLNYLNGNFEAIAKTGKPTIETAKQFFENKNFKGDKTAVRSSRKAKRTNFQNFSQNRKTDLDAIIKKKANRQNR